MPPNPVKATNPYVTSWRRSGSHKRHPVNERINVASRLSFRRPPPYPTNEATRKGKAMLKAWRSEIQRRILVVDEIKREARLGRTITQKEAERRLQSCTGTPGNATNVNSHHSS